MDFKDHWDLETALTVVQNKTVDSELWAEAVEWLLLHGPPEVVSILLQASGHATQHAYPELTPTDYTEDGQPIYDMARLAESLQMSEDEVEKILRDKQKKNNSTHYVYDGGSQTVH